MTRDEQLIKAALDMAAATCEQSAYAADADGHHFAYSIRAIDPAEVLAGLPPAPAAPDDVAMPALLASHVEWLNGDHEACNPWLADMIEAQAAELARLRRFAKCAPDAVARLVEAAAPAACDQCRHWSANRDEMDTGWREGLGRCQNTPHSEDVGEWKEDDNGDFQWVLNDSHRDRTAVVQDASGYSATLYTKPAHFCAMFTPQENDDAQ